MTTAPKDPNQYGGRLFHNPDTGLSGCPRCGWSGVPVIHGGERQTYCPACESPFQEAWERTKEREELTGGQKVGRNEPCPCGSGKKWKKCHGSSATLSK